MQPTSAQHNILTILIDSVFFRDAHPLHRVSSTKAQAIAQGILMGDEARTRIPRHGAAKRYSAARAIRERGRSATGPGEGHYRAHQHFQTTGARPDSRSPPQP